jgi:hypothetical protein
MGKNVVRSLEGEILKQAVHASIGDLGLMRRKERALTCAIGWMESTDVESVLSATAVWLKQLFSR